MYLWSSCNISNDFIILITLLKKLLSPFDARLRKIKNICMETIVVDSRREIQETDWKCCTAEDLCGVAGVGLLARWPVCCRHGLQQDSTAVAELSKVQPEGGRKIFTSEEDAGAKIW